MSGATQLTDEFLFESSLSPPEASANISKGKSMSYVVDLNQGSYTSGIVSIDATNQLNGSQGYASLREGYITIPFVSTIKNGSGALSGSNNLINQFISGLKCNTATIIDKVQIELNGNTIITPSGYLSHWNNLRAMTEWSDDDIKTYGSSAMMFPDETYSVGFSNGPVGAGDGFTNNAVGLSASLAQVNTSQTEWSLNGGYLKRLLANPPIVSSAGTSINPFNWPTTHSAAAQQICATTGKGAIVGGLTSANSTVATFYYLLRIRLVDIHPIFKTLDLCANPQFKLTLYINTGTSTINVDASKNMSLTSTVMQQGNTCPVMISSAAANNPMNTVLGVNATSLQLSWGVMGNSITNSGVGSFYPYATTRLYIPFYDLQPDKALEIVKHPKKKCVYLDYNVQSFKNQAGAGMSTTGPMGTNFSLQLSSSIKNAKYVALLPYSNTSVAGAHFATATNIDQYASPFDSAPWTCQAGSAITSFNVQVGNKWVFNAGSTYDFSGFLDEFVKIGSIYGGMSHELGNGLIDEDRWSYGQRIMLADVSRLTSKDVPQSLLITGTNSSSQGTDFLVLVAFERSFLLDRITGEVENIV